MESVNKDRPGKDREVIGLISDTHGVLDTSAIHVLQRASRLIIHAGDVGDVKRKSRLTADKILQELRERTGKEVVAVRGNVDEDDESRTSGGLLPEHWVVTAASGKKVFVLHVSGFPPNQVQEARKLVAKEAPAVVVFGHSHVPGAAERDGVLYINPGSAGPRRFKLPRCLALLHIEICGGMRVEFVPLTDSPMDEVVVWMNKTIGGTCGAQCGSCQSLENLDSSEGASNTFWIEAHNAPHRFEQPRDGLCKRKAKAIRQGKPSKRIKE